MAQRKNPRPITRGKTVEQTILENRHSTARQIKNTLAQQGIEISEAAIKQARSRMKRRGIASGKIFKTRLSREMLSGNSHLSNAEVAKMLTSYGVSVQNVRDARSQLNQSAPRTARAKAYPNLTQEHIRLIEKSLPILQKLVRLKTASHGRTRDYSREAFLELSAQLPHWIVKKRPGSSLEAFLDFKTRMALKDFWTKTTAQESGLKQKEVRQGVQWLKELKSGNSYEQIAGKHKVNPQEVKEITNALQMLFNTASTTRLKDSRIKNRPSFFQ